LAHSGYHARTLTDKEAASQTLVSGKHRRRKSLDGIRAVAILAVFASHSYLHGTGGGWIGVEVFFVLSGYLITTLLLNEHRRNGRIALGRFYLRRILRLYPGLLVLLIACIPLYRNLGNNGTLTGYWHAALAAGLYFQDFIWAIDGTARGGFGHSWSLAVEEQFYIFWPLLLIFGLRYRRYLLPATIAAAVAGLLVVAVAFESGDPPSYFLPTSQMPLLLAGCALAIARERGLLAIPVRHGARIANVSLVGLAVLMIALAAITREHLLYVQFFLCGALSVLLILGLDLDDSSAAARFLSWRPLTALGTISYGFYLYYLVALEICDDHIHGGHLERDAVALVLTLLCAIVSYFAIERRFLKIKDRIGSRVDAIALPSSQDWDQTVQSPSPP
jgi:peptidoglycan/LPS O-acetylase OafA/YrhL